MNSSIKKILTLIISTTILSMALFSFAVEPAHADIPLKVGYQGRLKNASGVAQTGTYTFTIRVYDASSGGSLLLTDTQAGISVTDGYFALQINTAATLDFSGELWITTEVNSDGEMTPRIKLASVPYAYNSKRVGGLLPTQFLRNDTANSVAGAISLTSTGAAITLQGGAASTFSTTAGNITLQPAGSGTIATTQIGVGGAGSTTPDFLGIDVKSTTGDPAGGAEGYMYYNTFDNKFRCFEGAAWKDCDTSAGVATLQSAYGNGATITTAGSTDIALTLTSGNFTATGAGSVNLTPTGASSFTSGAALTLQGGAASTWTTTAGNLTLDSAATLNLGTTNAIATSIGKAGATTTNNGALTVSQLLTGNLGASVSGATTNINASSNFATNINTGTSTGAVSIGNAAAGAVGLSSGAAITLQGGAASAFNTTAGNITLQPAGTGTTANVQVGAGGVGSTTPDMFAVDVKSDAGDPLGGFNGAQYYNANTSKFRCFEGGAWKDCDTTGGTTTLQSAYGNGATITTAGSTNIAYTLTSGNFTATGAGAVNLTPTSASSFTSGATLTLTGGAASTWSTTAGNLTLDSAATLNLGTTNATAVSIGKTASTTTVNGPAIFSSYTDYTPIAAPAYQEGRLFYHSTDKSLAGYTDIPGVVMHYGRMLWLRVKNVTGSTILKGRAVYINGDDGAGIPTVALARADSVTTTQVAGITTADITTGSFGYATLKGLIPNLDTSSYTAGDTLYLSATTAGNLTTAKPASPNYLMALGVVQVSNASTGSIEANIASFDEGSFSTGSVSFGNSDGFTTQDNTNFFWDNTSKRLGIGDNTPTASLVVGSGDLFQVFGASGNVTTAGNITLNNGAGASLAASAGALTLQGGAASTFSTTAGNITLQPAGSGTIATAQIGAGGAGSTTPDFLGLDVKSTTGDPAGGAEGYMYYNTFDNKFRCFEGAAWKDCDTVSATLQQAYNAGATITTAGSTNIAFTLTSGNFTASGAGAVNLTPTSASSFTSGAALTLTGGAASTWSTSAGALSVDSAAGLNLGTSNATGITIGRTGVTTTDNGALTVTQLLTGNLGLTVSGAAASINASSNFATSINTGSSTGAVTIGNSSAGAVGVTSGAAITLQGGAASAFNTTVGNITLQPAGSGTTANVQIGAGGAGSTTPDLFVLDIKSTSGDPAGTNGAMYYNANSNTRRCYDNGAWGDCSGDVNAANYTFAYDTTAQAVTTANTFQDITFNTNGQLNGWTHSAGTATFTCNQAGLYLVSYDATFNRDNNGDNSFSFIALKNAGEVAGSQKSASVARATVPGSAAHTFIVSMASTDTLKIQFTASANANTQGLVAGVSGTTKTSASVNIVRIQ